MKSGSNEKRDQNLRRSSKKSRRPIVVGRRCFLAGVVVASVSIGSTGCQNIVRRGQSPDDQFAANLLEEEPVKDSDYIDNVCGIWGLKPAVIEGVGLAIGLEGSGSNPMPSGQQEYLLREMQSLDDIEGEKTMIASENSSMVLLRGKLPAGIRKGDRFDIEVRVMPNSETTDLRHGQVLKSRLKPNMVLRKSVKQGHTLGLCKGNILTNALFESRKDKGNKISGWILGGGVAIEDRPVGLTVRTDNYSARTTTLISRAINTRFSTLGRDGRTGVATPKTDKIIELAIPHMYRHNVGRYMQVVVNIAFNEKSADRVNRLDLLDQEVNDPRTVEKAAIRLEAYGEQGLSALKRALRHHDTEVKFYVAQALAYMQETDGVDILIDMAENEPAFRWHALTALASLEDLSGGAALAKLMHSKSAEARYGAFRAMRARSPLDPTIRGTKLANDFYLHVVATDTAPMLHFAKRDRPEIVCFGRDQKVTDSFLFVETGLTVKSIGGDRVRISRFVPGEGEIRKVCSTEIPELVRTLSDVGCDYSTMLEMFRQAKKQETLSSELVINAVPKLGRKFDGVVIEHLPERSNRFIAGDVPDLFRANDDSDARPIPRVNNGAESMDLESKKKPKKGRVWTKMKGWFAGGGD